MSPLNTPTDPTLAVVVERLDQLKAQRAEDRSEHTARFDRMEAKLDKNEQAVTERLEKTEAAVEQLNGFMNRATGGMIFLASLGALVAWIADIPGKIWSLFSGNSAA